MKIKSSTQYFNDSIWGIFYPDNNKEDTLVLIKTFSSYRIKSVNAVVEKSKELGYKVVKPISRKFFKYSASVARIVPMWQRLIVYKEREGQPKELHRWREVKWDLHNDQIMYNDTDLKLMKDCLKVDEDKLIDIHYDYKQKKTIYNLPKK